MRDISVLFRLFRKISYIATFNFKRLVVNVESDFIFHWTNNPFLYKHGKNPITYDYFKVVLNLEPDDPM